MPRILESKTFFSRTLSISRPSSERDCSGESECDDAGSWFAGPYGACSAECDGGKRSRTVFCVENGEPVAPDRCAVDKKPLEDGDCNEQSCESDEDGSSGSGSGEEEEIAETTTVKPDEGGDVNKLRTLLGIYASVKCVTYPNTKRTSFTSQGAGTPWTPPDRGLHPHSLSGLWPSI